VHDVTALIVAGGLGTRLHELTAGAMPKGLVTVAGVPIIHRQMRHLARYGISRLVVMAGHLAQELEAGVMPEALRLGLDTRFVVEDRPMGTAGNLSAAARYLKGGELLVLYGDMAVGVDLPRLLNFHRGQSGLVTIACHPNDHPETSDLIATRSDHRVTDILSKKAPRTTPLRNLVPAALFVLSPEVLGHVRVDAPQDFMRDVFPGLLAKSLPIMAYNTPEYLRDTGSPERHAMVARDIESGRFEATSHWAARPAAFLDRDGVLVQSGVRPVTLMPGAAEAVRLLNEAGVLTVLTTNQPAVAKGHATLADIEQEHARLDTLLGLKKAWLDRIYFCPHHPEVGHAGEDAAYKIVCDCRKPAAGMIRRALTELPVDLGRSVVIGDSWRDAGLAREVGIEALGVETGEGCRDGSSIQVPDRMFPDVLAAARHVIQSRCQTLRC